MGEWGSWQHGFRRVSRVGLAAQFSQGQRGGERSTVFAGLRRVTRVGLAAQFWQGQRGGVGSKSVIYWLRMLAFADILCSQLGESFRAGTDLA